MCTVFLGSIFICTITCIWHVLILVSSFSVLSCSITVESQFQSIQFFSLLFPEASITLLTGTVSCIHFSSAVTVSCVTHVPLKGPTDFCNNFVRVAFAMCADSVTCAVELSANTYYPKCNCSVDLTFLLDQRLYQSCTVLRLANICLPGISSSRKKADSNQNWLRRLHRIVWAGAGGLHIASPGGWRHSIKLEGVVTVYRWTCSLYTFASICTCWSLPVWRCVAKCRRHTMIVIFK